MKVKEQLSKMEQEKMLNDKIFGNPIVDEKNRKFFRQLLPALKVEEVYMGDKYAYSCEVLVILAKPLGEIAFRIENQIPYWYVKDLFFIECCLDKEEGFAIQVSNGKGEPIGYIDLS